MASNLTLRIAFAAVAIPLAVGVLWLGGWLLAAVLAVLGVLGTVQLKDPVLDRPVAMAVNVPPAPLVE